MRACSPFVSWTYSSVVSRWSKSLSRTAVSRPWATVLKAFPQCAVLLMVALMARTIVEIRTIVEVVFRIVAAAQHMVEEKAIIALRVPCCLGFCNFWFPSKKTCLIRLTYLLFQSRFTSRSTWNKSRVTLTALSSNERPGLARPLMLTKLYQARAHDVSAGQLPFVCLSHPWMRAVPAAGHRCCWLLTPRLLWRRFAVVGCWHLPSTPSPWHCIFGRTRCPWWKGACVAGAYRHDKLASDSFRPGRGWFCTAVQSPPWHFSAAGTGF